MLLRFSVFVFASAALLFITSESVLAQSARSSRICVDNTKNRVVTKRRCRAPRFTEVTPDALIGLGNPPAQVLGNVVVVNEVTDILLTSRGDTAGNSADCPDGYIATGGGVSIIGNDGLLIRRSIPSTSSLNRWFGGVEADKSGASGEMSIYVVCALSSQADES